MLRIAICILSQDEASLLCEIIDSILSPPSKFDLFSNGHCLLNEIKSGVYYDILVVDLYLDGMTGLDIATHLRNDLYNNSTQVVFLASSDKYLQSALLVNPIGFLTKPINIEQAKEAFYNAAERARGAERIFCFYSQNTVYKVNHNNIRYFQSNKRLITIVTDFYVKYFYDKLDNVEKKLNHPDFLRIHQSILVNLNQVRQFDRNILRMSEGTELLMSRGRQKYVKEEIKRYTARLSVESRNSIAENTA